MVNLSYCAFVCSIICFTNSYSAHVTTAARKGGLSAKEWKPCRWSKDIRAVSWYNSEDRVLVFLDYLYFEYDIRSGTKSPLKYLVELDRFFSYSGLLTATFHHSTTNDRQSIDIWIFVYNYYYTLSKEYYNSASDQEPEIPSVEYSGYTMIMPKCTCGDTVATLNSNGDKVVETICYARQNESLEGYRLLPDKRIFVRDEELQKKYLYQLTPYWDKIGTCIGLAFGPGDSFIFISENTTFTYFEGILDVEELAHSLGCHKTKRAEHSTSGLTNGKLIIGVSFVCLAPGAWILRRRLRYFVNAVHKMWTQDSFECSMKSNVDA